MREFENDIFNCLEVLKRGGTILYPTDTTWGIGCDATNQQAVEKIYQIKNRDDQKSMIILVAEERDILQYAAAPDPAVFDFIQQQIRPTTIIFEYAIGLAENVIAADGSVAIRVVQDKFCRHLIKRLRKPVVSTSANISGEPPPLIFAEISEHIKQKVDYVVQWRQDDKVTSQASQIIKWNTDSTYTVIRS
ncbi:MAG: threonylcarbamoyl-AMP synthase [Chitinophagaceae bacterium]|nr:threonylcarbamoyl-AMP synthase [Chitinophagaceae bacterium]